MSIRSLLAAAVALALVGVSGTALAHTRQKILDDEYELVVGWKSEPPFAGLKNGLDLCVNHYVPESEAHEPETGHGHEDAPPTEPVAGLVDNLTVTYEIVGKTFNPPDWRGQHGRDGCYTAEITPTAEGEYTVHVVGTIADHKVDVRVKPHAVEGVAATMFPLPLLSEEDTTSKIRALETKVANLTAELAAMKQAAQSQPSPTPVPAESPRSTPGFGAFFLALGAVAVALVSPRRRED